MACSVLYKGLPDQKAALQSHIETAVNEGSARSIIEFMEKDVPSWVRFIPDRGDTIEDVTESRKIFINDLDLICEQIKTSTGVDQNQRTIVDDIKDSVLSALIAEDNTQDDDVEVTVDAEPETAQEVRDMNSANLNNHLDDLYGGLSSGVREDLKQNFSDRICAVAYWDQSSGEVFNNNNERLNEGIRDLKARFFRTLVQYLKAEGIDGAEDLSENMYKENGKLDSENYSMARTLFYVHFYEDKSGFRVKLGTAYRDRMLGKTRRSKADVYRRLVKQLYEKDPLFQKRFASQFAGKDRETAASQLYTADHFSRYFYYVRDYVRTGGMTNELNARESQYVRENADELNAILDNIEAEDAGILEAAWAYSSLSQFDNLLQDQFKNQIEIAKGTHGHEAGDKYSYSQDTSHQNKNFQDTEDVGTQKHTAIFTEAAIKQIRLYDYNTGAYMRQRITPQLLITSAKNVIDALVTGKAQFPVWPDTSNNQKAAIALRRCLLTFHADPLGNTQKMLELLFERPDKSQRPLIDFLTGRNYFDDLNLSVLKSLYDTVFNRNNPTSLYSQALKNKTRVSTGVQFLLNTLVGFIDSNINIEYLTISSDFNTGQAKVTPLKKFFNNADLYRTMSRVNEFANVKSLDDRIALQDKYRFRPPYESKGSRNTNTDATNFMAYTVTVGLDENGQGGFDLTVKVPKAFDPQILGSNPRTGSISVESSSEDLFDRLDRVDLVKMNRTLQDHGTLEGDQVVMQSVLQFLDDTIGLGILTNADGLEILNTFKATYADIEGMKHYLMPLIKLGIRAMYINSEYVAAGDRSLLTYITQGLPQSDGSIRKSIGGSLYQLYKGGNNKKEMFSEQYNDLRFVEVSYADEAISKWVDARSILNGDMSKATTKDGQGKTRPVNSVGSLSGLFQYHAYKQKDTNMSSLAFVRNNNLIVQMYNDLEVTTMEDRGKPVTSFSKQELIFHSIFNKFWGTYLQGVDSNGNGTIIVQPTVYSDKSSYINYEVKTNGYRSQGTTRLNLMTCTPDQLVSLYRDTLGPMYRKIADSSRAKMFAVVNTWRRRGGLTEVKTLKELCEALRDMTEDDLTSTAFSMTDSNGNHYSVERETDYRVRDGHLVLNEMLDHNSRMYNNTSELSRELDRQRICFLNNLVENRVIFQVLNADDSVDNYAISDIERSKSHNTILYTILNYFNTVKDGVQKRIEYFTGKDAWVDRDSGRLILAKQNGRNILSTSDTYDHNAAVVLNPLLDKFFLVEGLVSNNLRFTLKGVEYNHPVKGRTPFARAQAATTMEEWNTLGYGQITDQAVFNRVRELLLQNPDPVSLEETLRELQPSFVDLSDMAAMQFDNTVNTALNSMLDAHYLFVTNNTQGTQFKRNNIIPATLEYCVQNNPEGVAPKIKWAVIEDLQGSVFNYRGDDAEIDAHDGSAWVSPFQRYLEDKSLGPQAVGESRKFICHHLDTENGTAFQAKFAAYSITNSLMAMSMQSDLSLFKLFKRMHNMQWKPEDNIDLTQSIISEQSFSGTGLAEKTRHANWFNTVILDGQRLYYKDKYGAIVEITDFNKSKVDEDGFFCYYTMEKAPGEATSTRKYHIFYDSSTHAVFNTYEQAKTFASEHNNSHTINSLYELHTALGSIHCVDAEGNISELNNKVVVNFMNSVGRALPGVSENTPLSQKTHSQPLKNYMVAYAASHTAIKEGAKNINRASTWTDDSELMWFETDTDGLGVQLNAEHEIIGSELTEFSQVIAATAAFGWTYDQCNELYEGLARAAVEGSKVLLESVQKFTEDLTEENRQKLLSDFYEAVARIIFDNRVTISQENLTVTLLRKVQEVVRKYHDHTNDKYKLMASDPNIYKSFCSTLATTITKASIKRKHPGSGSVQAPGYQIMQYWEVPDRNGNIEKLFAHEILERARKDYHRDLVRYLAGPVPEEKTERGVYYEVTRGLQSMTTSELEARAISERDKRIKDYQRNPVEGVSLEQVSAVSDYLLETDDIPSIDSHLIRTWLDKRRADFYALENNQKIFKDKSWFMPSDIVEVRNADGVVINEISLKNLATYRAFKNTDYGEGCTYTSSITRPHDLRPSTMRWQVNDNGTVRYMNFFDLAFFVQAEADGTIGTPIFRKKVQDALNLLNEGKYEKADGTVADIVEGSLENEAAEYVGSNMYKEVFDIDTDSLAEVLAEGENYFRGRVKETKIPANGIYDLAFLGNRTTLVTIGGVNANGNTVVEVGFGERTRTTPDGRIMYMKNGKDLFEVGRWVEAQNVNYNAETDVFESTLANPVELDQERYRVDNTSGKVLERIDLVRCYKVHAKKKTKSGYTKHDSHTLYQVADLNTIRRVLGEGATSKNVSDLIGNIIRDIYHSGDYKMVEVNPLKGWTQGKLDVMRTVTKPLLQSTLLDQTASLILTAELNAIQPLNETLARTVKETNDEAREKNVLAKAYMKDVRKQNKTALQSIHEQYLNEIAHAQWVSFQDSRKFVSSRIPAQTLQSFLSLNLVGWLPGSNSIAFISHFQTYLQGSDYDIDKANIMGQSYDSSGKLIQWSPLFDYSSLATLEASKRLPIPRNDIQITDMTNMDTPDKGADLAPYLRQLSQVSVWNSTTKRLTADGLSEAQKVRFLNIMEQAIRLINNNDGRFWCSEDIDTQQFISTVNAHQRYSPPADLALGAYKNSAASNVYLVANDVRNRDQAYTALTMSGIRETASHTPKSRQESNLNMLNPLTKYMMQYANKTGKNVVGITANGIKFWFNFYYYWTHTLINGTEEEKDRLRFSHTFTRIKGRAKGTAFDPAQASMKVINPPDLDFRNATLKSALDQIREGVADLTDDPEELKYIDQRLSELLSAATDNAKELILDKLNVDENFAATFIFLVIMGCDVNDVAAFMTSPIAEVAISRSAANIFDKYSSKTDAGYGIDQAYGITRPSYFLQGSFRARVVDNDTNEEGYRLYNQLYYMKQFVVRDLLEKDMRDTGRLANAVMRELDDYSYTEEGALPDMSLQTMMQGLILALVRSPYIGGSQTQVSLFDLFSSYDMSIGMKNYLRFCQDIINDLRVAKSQYHIQQDSMDALKDDIKEFKKIYDLAGEVTTVTVGLLGLNQGLPSDKVEQIKKLLTIKRIVSQRERLLGISKRKLFKDMTESDESTEEVTENETTPTDDAVHQEWMRLEKVLTDNNPFIDSSTIRNTIEAAHELGIVNGFDPYLMVTDEHYRQVASDYLNLIKGTVNGIDMVYAIPHYKQIMGCFRADLIADRTFSAKSRLIDKLVSGSRSLSDEQLQGILLYADKLSIRHFLAQNDKAVISLAGSGIDRDAQGFTMVFTNTRTTSFDLKTDSGAAGFMRFMVTDFLSWLKANYSDNLFVQHLSAISSGGKTILAVDADLMNPHATANTTRIYDECVSGIRELTRERFNDDYTITSLLEVYNMVLNANMYGTERLTTLFQDAMVEGDILSEYLAEVGNSDYDYTYIPEFNMTDLKIAAAPIISEASQIFHTEDFVKVKDNVWNYILKKRNRSTGEYTDYRILPGLDDTSLSAEESMERRVNFAKWCPYEMPNYGETRKIQEVLGFSGSPTESVREAVRALLNNLYVSDKIKLVLDNC